MKLDRWVDLNQTMCHKQERQLILELATLGKNLFQALTPDHTCRFIHETSQKSLFLLFLSFFVCDLNNVS